MSSYQLTLKFYSQKDHVHSVVEEFHQTVSKFVQQANSSPSTLQSARKQLDSFYQHLSNEIERFKQIAQKSNLANNIKPYTDKLSEQTQQLSKVLREHYPEWSREDWQIFLGRISSRLHEIKKSLYEYDFKEAMGHMAEAVLLDHFDNLGQKQKVQWLRKIWHMTGSILLVSLYLWMPLSFSTKIWMFAFSLLTFLCLDIYRLRSAEANTKVFHALKFIMRKQEATRLSSTSFYMISCFLVVAIFPKSIAILSMLFLGFGDSIASIVGVKWGKRRPNKRYSLAGSMAFFTVCFAISFIIYPILSPQFSGPLWLFAIIGGTAGALSERCAGPLDDNLSIPIFSAIFLWMALLFF